MDRVSRKREKRNFYLYLGILILLVGFFAIFGIQLFTRLSLMLAPSSGTNKEEESKRLVLVAPRLDAIAEATNSAAISVSGYANEGETVEIATETDVLEVLVGKDGKFIFSDVKLSEGENRISAKAIRDKKESPSSSVLRIIYKKTPPKLEISEPSDSKEFVGDEREVLIKGTTDPDVEVNINDRFVRVNDDGSFEFSMQLSEGETTLNIIATDVAGNQSKIERKVKYRP